ncbi:hypothetical protein JW926_12840, partial [Candidatus Sumerlaeota bacterium]|nr:hypothetical protein [Candidatus Sumerlaeota bacterium]
MNIVYPQIMYLKSAKIGVICGSGIMITSQLHPGYISEFSVIFVVKSVLSWFDGGFFDYNRAFYFLPLI